MNLSQIINEEINKYVNGIIRENNDENIPHDKDENNGYKQFQQTLQDLHQNGQLNIRKLAANINNLSTSTKNKQEVNRLNAKASKLRKEIYGEEGANGGHFHLDGKDVSDIQQALSSEA